MRAIFLAAFAHHASANMYDAFSPDLPAPAKCEHGCAEWSTKDASIWRGGKVPENAGKHCAHVGSLVNSKTLGAWCYCASGSSDLSASLRDDFPLDGMTFALKDNNTGLYLGFAYKDAPAGLAQSTSWMRAKYPDAKDGMPLLFKAVIGQKDTYTLYNQWSGYEDWVSFTWKSNYVRAHYSKSDAMPTKFVLQDDGSYVMINEYPDARGKGKYWNLDANTWLQTEANDTASALKVTLETATGGGGGDWDYCGHSEAVPEQINIQIAGSDAVVISWVTFESSAPTAAPSLFIGQDNVSLKELKGVTHVHKSPSKKRTYYMHFVRAERLAARERYHYQVQSGGTKAVKSSMYSFRAPYASGETKLDIYGDMGIYDHNNLEQLYQDCVKGNSADLIVHMGDISYNMGISDEARADGFFNAFQQTIANCPWLPNVGNHEYYSGEELARYLDGTWQKWGPIAGGVGNGYPTGPAASTATSALGAFLTTSMHHGPGVMGKHPSNTSRYFSLDFGIIHLIALDLNGYYGTDPCGEPCKEAQLAWLEEDLKLANENREAVPWVLAFSHYPLYCSGCNAKSVSAAYYASDEAEFCGNGNSSASQAFAAALSGTELGARVEVAASHSANGIIDDFQPLFDKYSLDLYLAGHWHYYESLWPVRAGSGSCKACGEPTQKSFEKPSATVHVTTGNGGPPSKDTFCESGKSAPDCDSIPATRKQTNEYSSGRIIAHNRTHLTFQQIFNANGSIFDEWTIHQPAHPFAAAVPSEIQV